MPSRADQLRSQIELGLRAVALAALVAALAIVAGLFGTNAAEAGAPAVFRGDSAKAANSSLLALVKASLIDGGASSGTLRPLHVLAKQVPSDTNRALASAARTAGVPLSWTDSTKSGAVAVEARALIDPRGGYTLRVAAPESAAVAFRDSLGLIDSVSAAGGGGSIVVGRVAGSISAVTTSAQATAPAPAPQTIRRILVFGEPGWESKFTVAALEERGWNVDVRYSIGKNVTVTQGAPVAPDTSRYAAVIALDSSARAHIAGIRRYAQTGGGVVIAGAATTLSEFGAMLPGRAGDRQPGVPGGLETATPLIGLGWRPITPDTNAAVVARNPRANAGAKSASVVARRFGAGRVVESGYDGIWEWRMAGPDGSVEAHRDWWSSLVSAAAFAPEPKVAAPTAGMSDSPGSAAPYADALAQLGAPSAMPSAEANVAGSTNWELILTVIAVACLLSEWASRRLRGVK